MLTSKVVGALVLLFVLTPVAKWTRRFIYALFDQVPIGNPADEAAQKAGRTMGALGIAMALAAEGIRDIRGTWSSPSASSTTTKGPSLSQMPNGGRSSRNNGQHSEDLTSPNAGGFLPEMRDQNEDQGKSPLLYENGPLLDREMDQQEGERRGLSNAFEQKANQLSGQNIGQGMANALDNKRTLSHGMSETNGIQDKSLASGMQENRLLNHEPIGQGLDQSTKGPQSQPVIYGPDGKPLPPSSQLLHRSSNNPANEVTKLSSNRLSSGQMASSRSPSAISGRTTPVVPASSTAVSKVTPNLSQRMTRHTQVAEKVARTVGGVATTMAGMAVGVTSGFRTGHHVIRAGTDLSGFVGRQVGRVTAMATHAGSTGIRMAQQKISDFRNSRIGR